MMNLSKDQLHMLRHMLGINTPNDSVPKPYRNYAAVTPNDPLFAELEALGAVERYMKDGSYVYYRCTGIGQAAAIASHKTIRVTRSKRRWRAYRHLREVCPDLTFKEFLTSDEFKKYHS